MRDNDENDHTSVNGFENGRTNCSSPPIKQSQSSSQTAIPPVLQTNGSSDTVSVTVVNGTNGPTTSVKSPRTRPNPFKLITCEKRESDMKVIMSVEAVCIVDIHAHCVQTEVIGLLGGRFDPVTRQLFILTAEPCRSIAATTTDLQCEMDPVSQAEAFDKISRQTIGPNMGLTVIGWYHSHPTFVPNPSLRDIETQTNFQDMFAEVPFIALILSPYSGSINPQNKSSLVSKYKCLMVSSSEVENSSSNGEYRVPVEFEVILVRREKLISSVLRKTQELMKYLTGRKTSHCMIGKMRGRDITLVSKLIESLRHSLALAGLSTVESNLLLNGVRKTVSDHLSTHYKHSNNNHKESDESS